ncbi:MAG TPA: glycosyltransferase [Thermoleophilaceae bacterium]|nr:glycosyltransferase [Thermoleophilaceae bacterium]
MVTEAHAADPLVAVVVPSHRRPHGLTELLDALAEQTLPRDRWTVVVAHTYEPFEARSLLEEHELGRAGVLRDVAVEPQAAGPAHQRNCGLRAARGDLVAFTDDDCRPAADWLERLVDCALAHPGAVVQGTTRPDPRDAAAFEASPHPRSVWVEAPGRNAQTCNILYPRELLEQLGGFDESFATAGEDVDLALRAQEAGAVLVGAPDALVHHAVDALSLREKLRHDAKWENLPLLIKRHPRFRGEQCVLGLWWKREHVGAALALAALAATPRRPWALVGLWPYYMAERRRHGEGLRARLRTIRELPAHWLVEIAEIGRFARGSIRYRTLVL